MISETDLILNSDGSVYHLGLRRENIADTILLVGDPERVPQVAAYWDKIEFSGHRREFVTQTGILGNQRLSVISTGIGTDNIDIVMHELDTLCKVNTDTRSPLEVSRQLTIVRIGTAGCLQPNRSEGGCIVSSAAIAFDGLLQHYMMPCHDWEYQLATAASHHLYGGSAPASASAISADTSLLEHFRACGFEEGLDWTCAGFYGPQGRNLFGRSAYPDLLEKAISFRFPITPTVDRITHMEMETSGIYGLSRLMGHRALSVSALLAHRYHHRFTAKSHQVMEQCIAQVLEALQGWPNPN